MFYKKEDTDADNAPEGGDPGRIDREAYHKDFETLEISVNASPQEVTDAYHRLKEAYSPELVSMSSPVGYALEKKRRQDMIGQIEAAYRSLQRLFEKEEPAPAPAEDHPQAAPPDGDEGRPVAGETIPSGETISHEAAVPASEAAPVQAAVPVEEPVDESGEEPVAESEEEPVEESGEEPVEEEGPAEETVMAETAESEADSDVPAAEDRERPTAAYTDFSGQTLREIREKLEVSLDTISLETKIRIPTLENLEKEKFSELPPEVYVKGFVKSYAQCLSIDPASTTRTYMEKYHHWKRGKGKKHRQQHQTPFRFSKEKGRKREGTL